MKNYNSDANSKDIITVDYLITGGRLFVYNKCKIEKNGQRVKRLQSDKFKILALVLTARNKCHSLGAN